MTASTSSAIHLREPGELLAAVPHLVGFHPADSLVVVTHRGPGRRSLGMTLRISLPPAEHYQAVGEQLIEPVLRHGAEGVTLVVIGTGPDDPSPDPPVALPGIELVELLHQAFQAGGVPVLHSLWTQRIGAGQRWYCYLDDECAGEMPDPGSSVLAAASAATGVVTYRSREELTASLAADDDAALERRATMIELADAAGTEEPAGLPLPEKVDEVMAAIKARRSGESPLSDELAVRLLRELADHRVRDACLLPHDPALASAAESLWVALTRMAPEPYRAEPACLLAISAYLRGDGALAGVAMDCAERADPDHRLTSLLRQTQQAGFPPRWLRDALRRSVILAQRIVDEQGADEQGASDRG